MAVVCKGVTIGCGITSHRQVDEAFCDDETIVGTEIEDVIRFEETMKKFESNSGATGPGGRSPPSPGSRS